MRRKRLHSNLRGGFTLLELLLVLLLVAISVATVVPRFRGTLGTWQLRETVWNLRATLQLASRWARVRQEIVVFALDERQGVFTVRSLQATGGPASGTFPSVGLQSFGQSARIVRAEGFQNAGQEKTLTFRPDGTPGPAILVLAGRETGDADEVMWQVTVDGRGAVRCEETYADDE